MKLGAPHGQPRMALEGTQHDLIGGVLHHEIPCQPGEWRVVAPADLMRETGWWEILKPSCTEYNRKGMRSDVASRVLCVSATAR